MNVRADLSGLVFHVGVLTETGVRTGPPVSYVYFLGGTGCLFEDDYVSCACSVAHPWCFDVIEERVDCLSWSFR